MRTADVNTSLAHVILVDFTVHIHINVFEKLFISTAMGILPALCIGLLTCSCVRNTTLEGDGTGDMIDTGDSHEEADTAEDTAQPPSFWIKTYGTVLDDGLAIAFRTFDGGYVIQHGFNQVKCAIIKLDEEGSIEWNRKYSRENEFAGGATTLQRTEDNSYIVAASIVQDGAWMRDIRILRLDSSGAIVWQKLYGMSGNDQAMFIRPTVEGNFVIAGYTESSGEGNRDVWIFKIDSHGNIVWQYTYGGPEDDLAHSMAQTDDGGYIVVGRTRSFGSNPWVFKLDENANPLWQKTYVGDDYAHLSAVCSCSGGGYILLGYIIDQDTHNCDILLLQINDLGNINWQKRCGGIQHDEANDIRETFDHGFILAGNTEYSDEGWEEGLIIRLDENGNIVWQKTYGGNTRDKLFSIEPLTEGGYLAAGRTSSFGDFGYIGSDIWIIKMDEYGDVSESCPQGIASSADLVLSETSLVENEAYAEPRPTNAIVLDTSFIPEEAYIGSSDVCGSN